MTQAPSEGRTRKKKSKLILPSAVNQEAVAMSLKKMSAVKLYTACSAKASSGSIEPD